MYLHETGDNKSRRTSKCTLHLHETGDSKSRRTSECILIKKETGKKWHVCNWLVDTEGQQSSCWYDPCADVTLTITTTTYQIWVEPDLLAYNYVIILTESCVCEESALLNTCSLEDIHVLIFFISKFMLKHMPSRALRLDKIVIHFVQYWMF